jgi:hypothetical protein
MRRLVIASACVALLATTALAQMPQPPGPTSYGQQADIQGIVKAFTMTPLGDLEGMILTDGTEIHVPPHLSTQLAVAVHQSEAVRVRGWRTNVPDFIVATALTGQRGQSVVDQGPPPPGMRPPPPPPGQPAPGAQQATVRGRVQQILHGPAGDVNGALLDDGTILKFPPPATWQAPTALQQGQSITALGWALSNGYGRVVAVQSVSADTTRMSQAAPPPPNVPGMAPPPPPGATGVAPPPPASTRPDAPPPPN